MGRIIFQRANLVDGEHQPQRGRTIVIEGERIVAVDGRPPRPRVPEGGEGWGEGPGDATLRPGDRVIDLAGKTLMPGMVQCHFHCTYHDLGARPGPFGLEHPLNRQALQAAATVKMLLLSGFTSAVGAGTAGHLDAVIKQSIGDGLIEGPRMLASSMDLITTGDSNDDVPWWWSSRTRGVARICDGPEEFRAAVRDEIKIGADMIKMYPTGGHGVRLPKEISAVTMAEMEAAAGAAHERGKKIRGHISSKVTLLAAVKAGFDVIDHADEIDGECIEAILKAGCYVVPSLYYPQQVLEQMEGKGDTARPRYRAMRHDFDHMCAVLPEAVAAGVKLVVGDDFGTTLAPHRDAARELEVYVRHAGIAPLDVIRWATRNGAELMGMGDRLGTIHPGKLADLLIVDGDPTVDITVLQDQRNIPAVMKGGVFVKDALG